MNYIAFTKNAQSVITELSFLKKTGYGRIFIGDNTINQLKNIIYSNKKLNNKIMGEKYKQFSQTLRGEYKKNKNSPTRPNCDYIEKMKLSIDFINHSNLNTNKIEKWNELKDLILHFMNLRKKVNSNGKIIFGEGNLDADIMFCGEAPGVEEEKTKRPFAGNSGKLLYKIIKAMGFSRYNSYFCNIAIYRPGSLYGCRKSSQEEISLFLLYLRAQISIIRPKVIIALGDNAISGLLGEKYQQKTKELNGTWSKFDNVPIIPTHHPSCILRIGTKEIKLCVWRDMLSALSQLKISITLKQYSYFK